jgi:LuxR family maltose regulon positive regulatory protein
LIQQLNDGVTRKLTLISAPAGYGKTTLASTWVQQSKRPAAWLSLDTNDNDFTHFMTYFITALQGIDEGIGADILAALGTAQTIPEEPLFTTLINEIADAAGEFIFVLDDYHVIRAQQLHDTLTFLLDHMPGNMHLVIISRADPSIPLPRMRIRGELTELRDADLRFSFEEAASFFNEVMNLSLSGEDVAALENRTEGWIAGLQVAALSMRGHDDIQGFIQSFTGSHRYILDYLLEEVIIQEPERIQTFLLFTSILDRMTGPLCDAVTGLDDSQEDGQQILELLERTNLFVVPFDDERRWFRYHHLFTDLLRVRLKQVRPDIIPELHRRASDWYTQNGFTEEALGHALATEDYAQATHLVVESFWPMMRRGEVNTIIRWLGSFPEEQVRNDPRLSLYYAQALGILLRLEDMKPYLRDAERALQSAPDAGMSGWVDSMRASLTRIQGNLTEAVELSRRALERVPEEHLDVRGISTLDLGLTYVMCDDLEAASQTITEAITLNQECGNFLLTLYALGSLAEVQAAQGRLHQASETYKGALHFASERGKRVESAASSAGMVHAGLAAIHFEWNDLDTAAGYALNAIELGERMSLTGSLLWGKVALGRVKHAQGDTSGALKTLQDAFQIIQHSKTPQWIAGVTACQVRLYLALDRESRDNLFQEDIARWVQTTPLAKDWRKQGSTLFLPGLSRDFEHLTLARVYMAKDSLEQAEGLLGWLLQAAETAGRTQSVIEVLALQALALQARDRTEKALRILSRALKLAGPEGYLRLFIDEGSPMIDLLRQAASRGMEMNYVSKLLDSFESREAVSEAKKFQPLVEPLSERELEVLRLLAAGLSNQQIAEELYLSINTVKVHAKNIYGKLNVHGRMQAVQHARELKIL